jgi:hypothetical protein
MHLTNCGNKGDRQIDGTLRHRSRACTLTLAPVLNTGRKRVLEQRQAEDSFRKVCKSTRSLIAGLGGNLGIVKIESRQ